MVMTESTMLPLGTQAPDFALPDVVSDQVVSLADFADAKALLVIFMCNHCPFVKHLAQPLAAFAKEYQAKGLAVVGINSNDVANYPDDHPDLMKQEVTQQGYTFPYLYDESQVVAKAYKAACTPDFFVFNRQQQLAYRGQFDSSRPGNDLPIDGADLRAACDAILAETNVPEPQAPSIGCNIKWKSGNAPDYFSA